MTLLNLIPITIIRFLSFASQTGYGQDFLSSTEDYNRFNTSPGIFIIPAVIPETFSQTQQLVSVLFREFCYIL